MNAALTLVREEPSPAEDMLRELVPGLIEAERAVARYRQLIAEQGRALARERGIAFIREEALRREFGRG